MLMSKYIDQSLVEVNFFNFSNLNERDNRCLSISSS